MPRGRPRKDASAAVSAEVKELEPMARHSGILPSQEEWKMMREYVDVLCNAGYMPQAYINSNAKALAVALKGWELGIPISQALEQLYESDGRLTMQADLMRACVQKSGAGLIMPTKITPEGAEAIAVRYGVGGRPDREAMFSFTLADAERAGLLGNRMWQQYPRELCLARVTSLAARIVFSDVLMGVVYTPEEISSKNPPRPEMVSPNGHGGASGASAGLSVEPPRTQPEPIAATQEEEEGSGSTTPIAEPPAGAVQMPQESLEHPQTAVENGHDGKGQGVGTTLLPEVPQITVNDRVLHRTFQVAASGGGVQIVKTAGVTVDQLRQIGKLTKAGSEGWEKRLELGKQCLVVLALPSVRHLTEAEAEVLLEQFRGTLPEEATNLKDLRKHMDELGVSRDFDTFVKLVEATHGGRSVNDLSREEYRAAVSEMRDLCRDPEAFSLLIVRALQDRQLR